MDNLIFLIIYLFLLFFLLLLFYSTLKFSHILHTYAAQINKMARDTLAVLYHTLGESKYLCDKGSYNL